MNEHSLREQTKIAIEAMQGRPATDEEVTAVWTLLQKIAGLTASHQVERDRRHQLLQRFPDGCIFTLAGYSCSICDHPAISGEAWLDQYGLKCGICQANINKGSIPPWLGDRRDAWYSGPELEALFQLSTRQVRHWCKEKILRPRIISTEAGKPHFVLFLLSEHKAFFPPKYLLSPQLVPITTDKSIEWSLRPWYEASDPRLTLTGFRIKRYLEWL